MSGAVNLYVWRRKAWPAAFEPICLRRARWQYSSPSVGVSRLFCCRHGSAAALRHGSAPYKSSAAASSWLAGRTPLSQGKAFVGEVMRWHLLRLRLKDMGARRHQLARRSWRLLFPGCEKAGAGYVFNIIVNGGRHVICCLL